MRRRTNQAWAVLTRGHKFFNLRDFLLDGLGRFVNLLYWVATQ